MENSTTILNEILQKLSLITKEDEKAQGIADDENVISEKLRHLKRSLQLNLTMTKRMIQMQLFQNQLKLKKSLMSRLM